MMETSESEKIVPQLLPIEKNSELKRLTIFDNMVSMLIERGLLDEAKKDVHVKALLSSSSDDSTYKIILDNYEQIYGQGNNIMIIKFASQKVSSISKASGFSDILTTYKQNPKILVVGSMNSKLRYQIQNDEANYPNLEIFLEKELMINIIKHVSQPKFIMLKADEAVKTMEEYFAKKRDMPKMLMSDPVALYYNAKPGDLFRVIRPSETAGLAPSYRLVIKGQIKEN